jgi:hypothetical protein
MCFTLFPVLRIAVDSDGQYKLDVHHETVMPVMRRARGKGKKLKISHYGPGQALGVPGG